MALNVSSEAGPFLRALAVARELITACGGFLGYAPLGSHCNSVELESVIRAVAGRLDLA